MKKIVPAFLAQSAKEFEEKLRLVEKDCTLVQVDVLDGSLFENTSWFDAVAVGQMATTVEFELHLMVENPIPIVEAWQKFVPTFKRAIVSAEMHRPNGSVTSYIKDILKLDVGVAINPETPLAEIESVLHEIDQLTVMGVHPGKSGQPFEGEFLLEKIKQARHHCPELVIEMDGGVTDELIQPLIAAGVDHICAASLIFKNEQPTEKLKQLNQLIAS